MPIFVRYERILNLRNLLKPDQWRTYKEELFGTDTEIFAPEHYNELEIVKSLGIDFRLWEEEYDIDLKARLIAKVQISSVVELVRRHDTLQRDKQRKREQEAEAKAKQRANAMKTRSHKSRRR